MLGRKDRGESAKNEGRKSFDKVIGMGFLEYYEEMKFSEDELTKFEKELNNKYYSIQRQSFKGKNYLIVKKLEPVLMNYLKLTLYGTEIQKFKEGYRLIFHHDRKGYLFFSVLILASGVLSFFGQVQVFSIFFIFLAAQFYSLDISRKKIHDELIALATDIK